MISFSSIHRYKGGASRSRKASLRIPAGACFQLFAGLRKAVFFDDVPTARVNELIATAEGMNLLAKALPFSFKLNPTEEKFLPACRADDAFTPVVVARDRPTAMHAHFVFEQVMADGVPDALRQEYCKEAGMLLGYPACCVKSFLTLAADFEGNTPAFSHVYNNTRGTRHLLLASPFRLIEHLPCSYSCQESIHLAQQTLSLIENEKRSYRPFIGLMQEIHDLLCLSWGVWKTMGFINPRITEHMVNYDSFFIFDGPAKKSYAAMKQVANIAKQSNSFTVKDGAVEFFTIRNGRREMSGMAPGGIHSFSPKLFSWSRP